MATEMWIDLWVALLWGAAVAFGGVALYVVISVLAKELGNAE